jgi:hypothetical protein
MNEFSPVQAEELQQVDGGSRNGEVVGALKQILTGLAEVAGQVAKAASDTWNCTK